MVVITAGSEVAKAGVHALEVVLELLDLLPNAAENCVLLGKDGAKLTEKDPQNALGGADHGSLHGSCLLMLQYRGRRLLNGTTEYSCHGFNFSLSM